MTTALLPAPACDTRERRRWLRALGRGAAGPVRIATLWQVADVGGAVGFTGGLALAVAGLPRGWPAALPGVELAVAAAALRGAAAWRAAKVGAAAAHQVKAALRRNIAGALFRRPARQRRGLGEGMTLLVEGVEAVDGYVARFAPTQAAGGVAPLLIAAAIALVSPVAAAIVLVTFVPFVVAMALAGGAAADEARRQFQALQRLSGLFADRLRALPVVLAFGGEARTTEALATASTTLADRTLRVLRIAFVSSASLEFFAALSVALVAVYCGFNLLRLLPFPASEQLDLPRAIFVLALAPEAYAPFRRLAAAYHARQAAEAAAEPLSAVLEQTAPERAAEIRFGPAAPAIWFRDVSVLYPGADAEAVSRFSLHVAPGEAVALIGPSGSGKSTLLHLVLGLLEPTGGELDVGGRRPSTDRRVGWAAQSPVVVPGDLEANLRLARLDVDPVALAAAAEASGLSRIPGGLARRIDERGGGLSGGERRRLGLARAMLCGAPLLLLDEPTAGLDADAETRLLPVIRRVLRRRTVLIATHSAAVAALADRTIILPG